LMISRCPMVIGSNVPGKRAVLDIGRSFMLVLKFLFKD
jgi:hypothetical protein